MVYVNYNCTRTIDGLVGYVSLPVLEIYIVDHIGRERVVVFEWRHPRTNSFAYWPGPRYCWWQLLHTVQDVRFELHGRSSAPEIAYVLDYIPNLVGFIDDLMLIFAEFSGPDRFWMTPPAA